MDKVLSPLETMISRLVKNIDTISDKWQKILVSNIGDALADSLRHEPQKQKSAVEPSHKRAPEVDIGGIWDPSTHHNVTKILDHDNPDGLRILAKRDMTPDRKGSQKETEFIATKESFDNVYSMNGSPHYAQKLRQELARTIRDYFKMPGKQLGSHERLFSETKWGRCLLIDIREQDAIATFSCAQANCENKFRWQDAGYLEPPAEIAVCSACLSARGKTAADVLAEEAETIALTNYFNDAKCEWRRLDPKTTPSDILNQYTLDDQQIKQWANVSVLHPTLAVELYKYEPDSNTLIIFERHDVDSIYKRTMRVLVHTTLGRTMYWLLKEK